MTRNYLKMSENLTAVPPTAITKPKHLRGRCVFLRYVYRIYNHVKCVMAAVSHQISYCCWRRSLVVSLFISYFVHEILPWTRVKQTQTLNNAFLGVSHNNCISRDQKPLFGHALHKWNVYSAVILLLTSHLRWLVIKLNDRNEKNKEKKKTIWSVLMIPIIFINTFNICLRIIFFSLLQWPKKFICHIMWIYWKTNGFVVPT